jgi:hypothetical protein
MITDTKCSQQPSQPGAFEVKLTSSFSLLFSTSQLKRRGHTRAESCWLE